MDPATSRRVGVLAQHLGAMSLGDQEGCQQDLERPPTAAGSSGRAGGSPSLAAASTSGSSQPAAYATATGRPTSYARVHGVVSRAPAVWRSVPSVQREQLTEVKYEKAVGEGIAKVRLERGNLGLLLQTLQCCSHPVLHFWGWGRLRGMKSAAALGMHRRWLH